MRWNIQQKQILYKEGACTVSKITVLNQSFFIVETEKHRYIRKSIKAVNELVQQINLDLTC